MRAAFDRCAAGESCPAIARFLNACGARPRRSAAFTRGSVLALLRNPVYTGAIVWNRRRYRRANGGGRGCSKAENPRPLWLTAEGCHEARCAAGAVSPRAGAALLPRPPGRIAHAPQSLCRAHPLRKLRRSCSSSARAATRRAATWSVSEKDAVPSAGFRETRFRLAPGAASDPRADPAAAGARAGTARRAPRFCAARKRICSGRRNGCESCWKRVCTLWLCTRREAVY